MSKNEYKPWIAEGISEVAYWKKAFLEVEEELKICIEALEKIVKKRAVFQDPNCRCKFCAGVSIAQTALHDIFH